MTITRRREFLHRLAAASRSIRGRLILAAAVLAISSACTSTAAGTATSAEPWGMNTVTPAEMVKELGGSGPNKPVIVCTAPALLYRTGHIPGAVLHGPASSPEGLGSLTAWAKTLPRSTDLVIYCGCCPINVCPNLRPAYTALKDLGFARVRVLILPDSFRADWVERGYPIER